MCGWAAGCSASGRSDSGPALSRPHDQAGAGLDAPGNLMQMIAPQGHAALGRSRRSAPLVHEDARAAPRNRLGPIPVGDEHEVVERIGAAQALMGAAVGGGDLEVVVRHGGVVRPEITEVYGNRPSAGRRDPVGTVEHADDAVCACGGGAVALLLGGADAAAADDAGVAVGAIPNT